MPERILRCADVELDLQRPQLMGVLNITPDSFSDGGELFHEGAVRLDLVREQATKMVAAGARVLDVGGESSRPGADFVTSAEEQRRVLPVVEAIADLDCIISVDTYHADTALSAIRAGARIINDITAGQDPLLLEHVAHAGVGYALMHMQGTPKTMQQAPTYQDVVGQVQQFLAQRVRTSCAAGIGSGCLLVDPGFGFGKSLEHNLQMLGNLESLRVDDLPMLVGISRKSMLGAITGQPVEHRLASSVVAAVIAAQSGADLIRVHDVAETADGLKVWSAVASHSSSESN